MSKTILSALFIGLVATSPVLGSKGKYLALDEMVDMTEKNNGMGYSIAPAVALRDEIANSDEGASSSTSESDPRTLDTLNKLIEYAPHILRDYGPIQGSTSLAMDLTDHDLAVAGPIAPEDLPHPKATKVQKFKAACERAGISATNKPAEGEKSAYQATYSDFFYYYFPDETDRLHSITTMRTFIKQKDKTNGQVKMAIWNEITGIAINIKVTCHILLPSIVDTAAKIKIKAQNFPIDFDQEVGSLSVLFSKLRELSIKNRILSM